MAKNTLAALLASETELLVGRIVTAEGWQYKVAPANATNHHLTTAGGGKLYVLPDGNVYNFKAFGPAANGTTDDYAKLMLAIGAASSPLGTGTGPAIYFPDARYFIGQTVELKKAVKLLGHGSGQSWDARAELKFPANTAGIVINRHDTLKGGTVPSTTGADCTIIEGLRITGGGGADHSRAGIWMRARAIVKNCYITEFAGDGIKIVADVNPGPTHGNANCWQVEVCSANSNGRHGMYIQGGDTNAGTCTGCDFSYNGQWGLYENSFLGNTFIGLHVDSNGAGSYWAAGASQAGVFLGCYEEGGHSGHVFGGRNLVLGGLMASGGSGGQVWASAGNNLVAGAVSVPTASLGGDDKNGDILRWDGDFRLRHVGSDTRIDHANLDAREIAYITGPDTPKPWPYVMGFPSVGIGQGSNARRHTAANAAPTEGAYIRGEVVWNIAPSAEGSAGWICVASGTPGTWAAFGAITDVAARLGALEERQTDPEIAARLAAIEQAVDRLIRQSIP